MAAQWAIELTPPRRSCAPHLGCSRRLVLSPPLGRSTRSARSTRVDGIQCEGRNWGAGAWGSRVGVRVRIGLHTIGFGCHPHRWDGYDRIVVCATRWWGLNVSNRGFTSAGKRPPLENARHAKLASERARRRATRGRRFALPKNAKHGRPACCLHPCRSKEGTVATTQRSADLCVRRPCDRWLLRRGTPFVCDAPSCGHGSARRTLNQCVARNARASLEWR